MIGFVRCAMTIAFMWLLLTAPASAVREFVILETPMPAQRLEGVVLDPSGAPIPGVTVSDCSAKWAAPMRTTPTDIKGRFRLSARLGKRVYYLRFDHPLFNPLGLRLSLEKAAAERRIIVRLPIGG